MPSVISCPSCQKQLKVPDDLLGKNVKCPGCKETFTAEPAGSASGSKSDIAEKPRKQAAPPPEEEEDDEPREKPARRRADDDDDDGDADERPSKRIKKRKSVGPMAPHRGVLWLVLGLIAALLGWITGIPTYLAGPFVWWLAKKDLAEIDAGRMDPAGRDLTFWGMVCGIVATVELGLFALLFLGICIFYCVIGGLIAGAAGGAH
jgi:predicted Zn finger-like uncharacterized protein